VLIVSVLNILFPMFLFSRGSSGKFLKFIRRRL
jgi:hypothetical protein